MMRSHPLFRLFIATTFCIVFSATPALTQNAVLLNDVSRAVRLDGDVLIFIDSTNNLTIADVADSSFQHRFMGSIGDLTFGYLRPTLWLKVSTETSLPDEEWLLEIPAPFLEYVDFYQRQPDQTWSRFSSGYFRKQSEKHFPHTGHIVPLSFKNDATNITYIQIAGVSPKTFPLYAIGKERFIQKTRLEDLGYGVFFGILVVMFLYNVYLYATLRQKNYFLYFCIIGCTILIFAAITGYGGKFLWPETPIMNYVAGKLFLEVLVVFITIYTMSFLEVKKYSKAMHYVLWSLIPLAVIALLLASTQTASSAGNHLITLSTVVYMAAGIVVRIKGNRTGVYFIAAWTFYFLGGLLLTLRNSGFFSYNFLTTHFVEIGAVLGTTIMGFGLAAQYRNLKREKVQAQFLAFKIQQEATAKLETKVNERTAQLFAANQELQRTLETNRRQTQIIESKNAELDTFFYRISHDLKGPISSSLGLMALAKLDVKDKLALEYIDKQHGQIERLSQLISGLVSLAKLNNGKMARQKIDFERMVEDCIMSFNTFKHFPRVAFEKDIQHDVEFYSEWTLINAILQNLIENAIKYCRGDSPFVRIKVHREADCIIIRVEDNGQGIPQEHQEKIFDMFYRATNEEDGSGLGLYILKRSVDRLNGTIEISSNVGVGSTFTVRLPRLTPVDGGLAETRVQS